MPNNSQEVLAKLKDPKFYLESFCKIKGKTPGMIPFMLNEAQKDIFNSMRRSFRIIILKARQLGFCLSPETRILTADYRWITLDEVTIGQEIVAVDEIVKGGKGSSRKMRKAIVEAKWDVFKPAFKIVMDNGTILTATGEHRFLFKERGAVHTCWRKIKDSKVGDEIRLLLDTWEEGQTYEDGWFGGIIDGEGSLCQKSRTGSLLGISQIEGPVWQRLLAYANNNKLNFRIEIDKRKPGSSSKFGSKDVYKLCIGQMSDIFKILGKCRPSRMVDKDWWTGKKFPGNGNSWSKIVSIESVGEMRMIDLQTSEKTFIAEGFVSHNSTGVTGFFYHNTITTPGTTTALIGYNSDLTAELLDKVKTFYKSTPAEFRPTIHYNSKYEISFPAIDSKILVLPSTENVGRGYTINNCLVTELSAWDKAEEKMMVLEASVPINGRMVVESTPRGQGNLYHRMWMSDNDYVKKEYGYWWLYTEEEIEIIKRRMNDPRRFAQEYGLEFLSSGRNVFDTEIIKQQRSNQWRVGETWEENGKVHFVKVVDGLRIYKDPEPDGMYVVGADVSEGVTGGDYSVAIIWNRRTGEEVAMFRGHIAPDRFGEMLDKWGRRYNNAFMVVEINNHGLTTVTVLRQKLYPTLYFRQKQFETLGSQSSDKIGWKTNKVTRPLLIDEFAQAVRDGVLTIHSKELLDEMTVFIYDQSGNMIAQEGFHDDFIFAAGIGLQGFKMLFDRKLDQINYRQHLPKSFAY